MVDIPNGIDAKQSEEIDLIRLIRFFWRRRLIIIAVAFFSGVVAGACGYLGKPVYEATILLQPPVVRDVIELNYGRSKFTALEPLTQREIFAVFARHLQSESLRKKIYNEMRVSSSLDTQESHEVSYERFMKNLVITEIPFRKRAGEKTRKDDPPGNYIVVIKGENRTLINEYVRILIDKASSAAMSEIFERINAEFGLIVREYNQHIAAKYTIAKTRREDSIVKLEEAMATAKSLGIELPVAGVAPSDKTMYLLGSKALRAQISTIKGRLDDSAFIPGLR